MDHLQASTQTGTATHLVAMSTPQSATATPPLQTAAVTTPPAITPPVTTPPQTQVLTIPLPGHPRQTATVATLRLTAPVTLPLRTAQVTTPPATTQHQTALMTTQALSTNRPQILAEATQ